MARMESLSPMHSEHGVFLAMYGLGILIRGVPGIGKSSLALELIDRGHSFIADDVVQFNRKAGNLIGSSPAMLFSLLAVRDIGVLNISKLYSNKTLRTNHRLDVVLELCTEACGALSHPLTPYNQTCIFEYIFPSQTIFAYPSRNLALIVETAIKNYILYKNDQDAGSELIARQQQYL